MVKHSIENANWIWLNTKKHRNLPDPKYTNFCEGHTSKDVYLSQFEKNFVYDKKIARATVEVCADIRFRLWINGKFIGSGPVCSGGDWGNVLPMKYRYFNTFDCVINEKYIDFFADVTSRQLTYCDTSDGKNGFVLSATVIFDDGTQTVVNTDETWQSRIDAAYRFDCFDYTGKENEWNDSEIVNVTRHLKPSEIPNLVEEPISFGFIPITIQADEEKTFFYNLDKIYSVYYLIEIQAENEYNVTIRSCEKDFDDKRYAETVFHGNGNVKFRTIDLSSVGSFKIEIENKGNSPVYIKNVTLLFCHYPVTENGEFDCSDEKLTEIYNMGKHALKICMQTIELDSPMHQENLGCAGDYYIASAMNYFTYGDTRLTRFDIIRIADYLETTKGFYFHTTYSLIYIRMIYEYYLFSGDKDIISRTEKAVTSVLEKMHLVCDEREIICNPVSFMFVDWLKVDDYSMHHPPKALGQTVLNAFYYEGMITAAKLFDIIENEELVRIYINRAKKLKKNFSVFYDEKRGLYFDGLNDEYTPNRFKPANTDKRYYSQHSNTLAVLFDLAPKKERKRILRHILSDEHVIKAQPYFMHFVLEAIYKEKLFDEFGIEQLSRWKYMTNFPKGLVEGWYLCDGYDYDYSHVWSGTPTYQLPSKISGLKILEPGFKKISLSPCLFGLTRADVKIPTPYGNISVSLKKDEEPIIRVPNGIDFTITPQ